MLLCQNFSVAIDLVYSGHNTKERGGHQEKAPFIKFAAQLQFLFLFLMLFIIQMWSELSQIVHCYH